MTKEKDLWKGVSSRGRRKEGARLYRREQPEMRRKTPMVKNDKRAKGRRNSITIIIAGGENANVWKREDLN